ncbi:hypothetical protein ACVW00_001004 [Marmoricola sp. URHA0025 HA25]
MSLDRLLGTWDLTMRHHAMAEPVSGRQRYERVLEGAYVRLDWSYDHPDFPDATAVLSEEKMWYFDVRGIDRLMDLTFDDEGWTALRIVPKFSQRSTARFDGDDLIETVGEFSEDLGDTWQRDYTMSSRRVR